MKLTTLLLTAAFASASLPAAAQVDSREGIALQNQILELRQQLQQLGAGVPVQPQSQPQRYPQPYDQGQPPQSQGPIQGGDTAAQLVVRVSALEEQMRQLQGRVDDISNALQRQNDQLSKQIGDLAFKLGQGGAAGGVSPQPDQFGGPPPESTPALSPPLPKAPAKRPPEVALREGNAALARRDYAAATAAAQEVMADGKPTRLMDAQMLLARAESGQHQYRQSAADFYQAYNHAPKSGQAPVALLGVANALVALNDPKDACQALAKINAEFPNPPPGVRAGAASIRKHASCH